MPLQDLNKIVNACVDAIFPLLNAFLILFMFTLVCAILGPSPFPRRLSASLWRARIRACSQARLQHLVAFSLVHPLRAQQARYLAWSHTRSLRGDKVVSGGGRCLAACMRSRVADRCHVTGASAAVCPGAALRGLT